MTDASAAGADWRGELRAQGYRLTPQRQLVLEAVDELGHARPEEILATVRQRASGVNMSTVYRTLELLEELGVVTHAHLGHGAPTYHSAFGPTHAHLLCRRCQRVTEVDASVVAPLAEALEATHGFAVDVAHLTVSGDCAECRSEGRSESGSEGRSGEAGRRTDPSRNR